MPRFLWVKYQLDDIFEQPSAKDVRVALNSLPLDLKDTYTRILKKIDRQHPSRSKIAKRALMWVVGAATSLSAKVLATAVSIEPQCKNHAGLEVY